MKKLIALLLILHCSTFSFAQKSDASIQLLIDSLPYMTADTFDCKAGLFWRIVARGREAIPPLMDKLTDTTPTNIRYHCKKTPLNVGEVAHFALLHIADFPAFVVTKIQFDVINIDETGQGCWSFYDFLFVNANKARYQKSMREWYDKEKNHYKTVALKRQLQADCLKQFGITIYNKWIHD
ncbi:MAG: hypothetical protein QM687_10395 [Ferruginibacter sp.]